MALTLTDLIAAKQKLENQEKQPERLSVGDLKKYIEDSSKNEKSQLQVLQKIEGHALADKTIQVAQAAISAKNDQNANEDQKVLIKKTTDLLENNKKMLKQIEKQSKSLDAMTPGKAKDISDKASKLETFETIGGRVNKVKDNVKDFFTLKGFLNKTGIIDKESKGIVATAVNRRAAKQQFVKDRMRVDPGMKNLKQFGGDENKLKVYLQNQFDQGQSAQRDLQATEQDISGLKERGFTSKQIARTGLYGKREESATKLLKIDSRFREDEKDQKKKAQKEATSKTERIQLKQSASVEKKEQKEKTKKEESLLDFSDESQNEAAKLAGEQVSLLAKIEENTRLTAGAGAGAKPKSVDMKSPLEGMLGGIGDALMSSFRMLFNPRAILRVLGKVFVPAMIVGSLVNGIIDGFKVFFNGGSLGDALIAGLGGILDFLTFGLIDAKTIKSIVDGVTGLFDKYILNPIKNFFGGIVDSVLGFITNFEIPGIGFTIPVINKKVEFGPWKPFSNETTSKPTIPSSSTPSMSTAAQVSTPAPQDANAVYKKSSDNADAAAEGGKQSAPIVVSAPTNISNNTSRQSIAMPAPTRNQDSGFNSYVQKNSAFI